MSNDIHAAKEAGKRIDRMFLFMFVIMALTLVLTLTVLLGYIANLASRGVCT